MGSRGRLSLRHAVALGLAHGPTELLPISSSAHTILIPWLTGWPYAELDPELRKSFEVALHAGTAAALLVDLRSIEAHPGLRAVLERIAPSRPVAATRPSEVPARQAFLIVLSFIPPAVVGFIFEQPLQRRLSGLQTIAAGLLLGAGAIALTDSRPPEGTRTLEQASACDGLLLGLAQTFALVPGVSRSGAVLSAARARGFSRVDSHTLARRTGLPVILGAGALKTGRLLQREGAAGQTPPISGALALGAAASFLSTLVATRLLRRGRETQPAGPLWPYSLYRGLLASLVIRRLRGAHNKGA
jgi:undecaprenyl-diphosphatase